jgi:hemin uptake protein HemP
MNSYNPDLHRHLRERGTDQAANPPVRLDISRFAVRTLSSASLFQRGEHEIGISHGDSLYRLKITRQGKLILNK